MNKSHVARFSVIGTITTFGIRRCEIKLGCNETAPSFAEITSPSSRLFPTPIETKRGRNLPNRRQNRAILWLYPARHSPVPERRTLFSTWKLKFAFQKPADAQGGV